MLINPEGVAFPSPLNEFLPCKAGPRAGPSSRWLPDSTQLNSERNVTSGVAGSGAGGVWYTRDSASDEATFGLNVTVTVPSTTVRARPGTEAWTLDPLALLKAT